MGIGNPESIHARSDVVLDYRGTVYCWPCAVAAEIPVSKGFHVTGQRLGREPCSICYQVGTVVLEVEASPAG